MDESWKDMLTFNRSERRGIWLLLILLIMVWGLRIMIRRMEPEKGQIQLEVMFAEAGERLDERKAVMTRDRPAIGRAAHKKDSLFHFDPNALSLEGWQKLGLSEKQAKSIVNYIGKGGRFRSKEDLRRSFVISEAFYQKVEPWITIARVEGVVPDHAARLTRAIHLNTADTAELKKLRGIGSVLAARIVQYRQLLGGFHSLEQLREVYGLSAEVIEMNKERMSVGTESLAKIPLNEAQEKQISGHPYISKKLAYVLIALRNEAPLKNREDLLTRLPAGTEIPQHLWPYLQF